MSQDEELKAFEAALAALVPRGDRLDRDRLMFLAGQASVGGISSETATGEGVPGVSPVPGKIHGQEARAMRRWAWPAAFSAMTAVAATLLAIVVTWPGRQGIERMPPVAAGGDGGGSVQGDPGRSVRGAPRAEPPPSWGPDGSWPGTPGSPPATAAEATALALAPLWRVRSPELAQRMSTATLAEVLDTVLPQAQQAAGTLDAGPMGQDKSSYHDLRDELLEKPGRRGFSPRPSVLEMFPPLGARS